MNIKKGQVVVIMLIIAMIIGIVIPGLVFLTQHEAKWTVKEVKSTRAFHLAEAGLDRGVYKLNETGIWDDVIEGTHITNYYGDKEYSDIEGGSYKIKLSTGAEEDEVIITASGKDSATAECRTIQAVYYKSPGVTGALNASGITAGGNFKIHWGPVYSIGAIVLSGSADNGFPRKYAAGQITCVGGGGHDHDDPTAGAPTSGPTGVNDEYQEWHDQREDITLPEIDFDKYKADAQAYETASGYDVYRDTSVATTTFSGAYVGGGSSGIYDDIADTFTTYYIENAATLTQCNLKGVIICKGNMTFGTSNKGTARSATPHADAWKEYWNNTAEASGWGGPDSTDTGEYPGDSGLHSSSTSFNMGNTAMRGFIYVGGIADCGSSPSIYGSVICAGSVAGTGSPVIYYDKTCAENIEVTSTGRPTRQSWKELPPQWDPMP
ncbi:MAG: hypothetical protein WC947_07470 [Elusimicrobiota bacterium]